jgi:hypothetical protein
MVAGIEMYVLYNRLRIKVRLKYFMLASKDIY